MRSSIGSNIFPPILTGRPATLMALQHHLGQSQWWDAERLRAEQHRQLAALVNFATRTIPFYADRLRAAGLEPGAPLTWQAWSRIPTLTRHDVQDAGDALNPAVLPPSHGRIGEIASGGSTGVPVRIHKSEFANLMWEAIHIREELWHREDRTGALVVIAGLPRSMSEAERLAGSTRDGVSVPQWGGIQSQIWTTGPLHMIDLNHPAETHVDFILKHAPSYIYTLPSTLRLILWHCRNRGIAFPGLRAVWTRSETVDDALRQLCQDTLGVRIVSNYSTAETGYIALQCPTSSALHVQSETCLVEILDADSNPVPPGACGRVVVTPLHNFATPLLRYEIGDDAECAEACSCGRGLPLLKRILGRTIDHLTRPDGRRRRFFFDHYALSKIRAVKEYQVIQRSLHRIDVLLAIARPLTDDEISQVRAIMAKDVGTGFEIDLSYCDRIPRTAAGKLRPVRSELPQQPD